MWACFSVKTQRILLKLHFHVRFSSASKQGLKATLLFFFFLQKSQPETDSSESLDLDATALLDTFIDQST